VVLNLELQAEIAMAGYAQKRGERRLEQFRSRTWRGEHAKGLNERILKPACPTTEPSPQTAPPP